jgi:hypothetical protein
MNIAEIPPKSHSQGFNTKDFKSTSTLCPVQFALKLEKPQLVASFSGSETVLLVQYVTNVGFLILQRQMGNEFAKMNINWQL